VTALAEGHGPEPKGVVEHASKKNRVKNYNLKGLNAAEKSLVCWLLLR